jgi:hypothetical protein
MKQILIELDDETASELESVAPARSRRRSDFVRSAIRRALWELREQAAEAAYSSKPDTNPAFFDAGAWELKEPRRARSPQRKRRAK